MLVLILAIAHGLDRALLALERPPRAGGRSGARCVALVVIVAATAALSPFLDAGDEQGLVPDGWDSSRAAPFLANAAVVVIAAPFVEELLYRGLGYGLLTQFVGPWPAILSPASPSGSPTGSCSACRCSRSSGSRSAGCAGRRVASIPGMIVHALFNAAALAAAVAL